MKPVGSPGEGEQKKREAGGRSLYPLPQKSVALLEPYLDGVLTWPQEVLYCGGVA